jgi:protease I
MELMQSKIGILLGDGFQLLQARYPLLRLEEEGYRPQTIGPEAGQIVPSKDWREGLNPTLSYNAALEQHWDLLIVPGGIGASELLLHLIHEVYLRGSYVAAVDSGVNILARSGILENRQCSARHLPFMDVVLTEAGARRASAPVTLDTRILTAEEMIHLPLFVLNILEILNHY